MLLCAIATFELLPVVEQARMMFPENFEGLSCHEILKNRPWYGRINTWLLFWLISTPIIIFSIRPETLVWKRALYSFISIGMGYIVINLSTHMAMDIRNAPFHGEGIVYFNGVLETSEADVVKHNCFDIADGGKYVGAILFGWIYALIYTGWWKIIWYQYHKRASKLIEKSFKIDWFNKVIILASGAISVFAIGLFIAKIFNT